MKAEVSLWKNLTTTELKLFFMVSAALQNNTKVSVQGWNRTDKLVPEQVYVLVFINFQSFNDSEILAQKFPTDKFLVVFKISAIDFESTFLIAQ